MKNNKCIIFTIILLVFTSSGFSEKEIFQSSSMYYDLKIKTISNKVFFESPNPFRMVDFNKNYCLKIDSSTVTFGVKNEFLGKRKFKIESTSEQSMYLRFSDSLNLEPLETYRSLNTMFYYYQLYELSIDDNILTLSIVAENNELSQICSFEKVE